MARLLIALCLLFAAPASAQTFNAQEQAEIRAVVREYLVNNPDVLREALDALETRVHAQRVAAAEGDRRDFSIGPANAPVTIVEFFDYRCPYCMVSLEWVNDVVRTRRDVRFVFKELPLDIHEQQGAFEASRASVAAMPQGRYFQFHRALMSFEGDLTTARIDQLARQSGIDVARMRRAMNSEEVTRLLEDNRAVAADLGVNGTPAFLINGEMVSGYNRPLLDQRLREATRAARERREARR